MWQSYLLAVWGVVSGHSSKHCCCVYISQSLSLGEWIPFVLGSSLHTLALLVCACNCQTSASAAQFSDFSTKFSFFFFF